MERTQVDPEVKNWVAFASSCYRTGLTDYNAKNYASALKHASVAGEVADALGHYGVAQTAGAAAQLPAPPER